MMIKVKKIKLLSVCNIKNKTEDLHINKDCYKSVLKLFYNFLENGNFEKDKTFVLEHFIFQLN